MSVSMKRQKRKQQSDSMIVIERKKEDWKKFSFRSVSEDGIDCGDKQCNVEYRVLPDCFLVLETNNTNCQIPCIMDGCDKELHHFIACPIWNCEAITTSTSTTTTSPTTTVTSTTTEHPKPKPIGPSQMSPLIYTSIVLNILFVGILLAYLIVRFRIWITTQLSRFRTPAAAPTLSPDPNRHFSVGSNSDNESESGETQPLISSTVNASRNSIVNHGHDNLGLNISNVDPIPSTSNWQEVTQAILGLGPSQDSGNPLPSSSNWDSINLASSSETSPENQGPALNDIEANKEMKTSEKSIFLRMKIFQKK